MNREIKFRAWNKPQSRMMEWNEVRHLSDLADLYGDKVYDFMQFTGVKDKNDKEIYEGDICSLDVLAAKEGTVIDSNDDEPHFLVPPKNDYMIGEIKFTNGMFGLFFQSDEGEFFIEMDSESMQIIGNIHENPELLK